MGHHGSGTPVVLKSSYIFLLFTFSLILNAAEVNVEHVYKRAYNLHSQGQYERALDELDKVLGDGNRKAAPPENILSLTTAIYQKLGDFEKGEALLDRVIQKYYDKENQIIQDNFEVAKIQQLSFELPHEIVLLYLLKSTFYNDILSRRAKSVPVETQASYIKFVKVSAELAFLNAYKESYAEKLLESINRIEVDLKAQIYYTNFFVSLGYFTWRDEIIVINNANKEVSVRSTNSGLGLSFGKRWANGYREHSLFSGLTFADATIGNDDPATSYFQSGVSVKLLHIGGGLYLRPSLEGSVAFGLEGIATYSLADFEDPPGVAKIKEEGGLSVGALVGLKWQTKYVEFYLKMGKILSMPSSFTTLGLTYHF